MSAKENQRKRKVGTAESPDYKCLVTPSPVKKRNCVIPSNLNVAEFRTWDRDAVASFLETRGCEDVARVLKENNVAGCDLVNIDGNKLEEYGISDKQKVGKVIALLQIFKAVPSTSGLHSISHSKVFNDPVHGHIEVHQLLVKIIDTPQFQRLRNIKQLGGCYFVFPGAAHNRFEHSIGTSHLAGRLVKSLKKRQPELEITEEDVLCVRIAGLCHDLGHGPFSHLFDLQFIPAARPGHQWKCSLMHEEASVQMFDHLVEVNDLMPEFEKYSLNRTDLIFIKELIAGPRGDTPAKTQDWPYRGRPKSKSYLYEIVANKRTGIDVDKWDYFARDCHNLGIKNSFDHKICEALLKADSYLKIEGKDGKSIKISEAIDDMVAYTKLTDHVYYQILFSSDPNLQPARDILHLVQKRQLYKCIGHTILKARRDKDEIPDICKDIAEKVPPDMDYGKELEISDIIVDLVTFDYGMKDRNPIDNVRFYTKEDPNQAMVFRKDQVGISRLLPESFTEQHLRVYCRSRDPNVIEKAKTLVTR
ncbi:hypothetical protein QZH41_016722 [Actinostola sp. cb2023]|nr:hypothetical protein QZH41_016722 [Actinostola sp. cb2023]